LGGAGRKGQNGGLGRDVTLRDAIAASLPALATDFADQPLVEARLRMTLGTSFLYLGEAETAAAQFQSARELYTSHRGPDHPDTLRTIESLATSLAAPGRHADALHRRPSAARSAGRGARPTSVTITPIRSPAWANWPGATTPSPGTPRPLNSSSRSSRSGKSGRVPTIPTRSRACRTWPRPTTFSAGTP